MTLDQLDIETVHVPTLVTIPSPGLAFPDPAYPLAQALRGIGCSCFSRRSVERYREEVVWRAKRQARRVENRIAHIEMDLTAKSSDLLIAWLPALLVCCYFEMLISMPVAFVTTSVLPFTVAGWGGAAGLLAGVAAACLHGFQVYRTQRLTSEEVESVLVLAWAETPLAEYRPTPNSVLGVGALRSLARKVASACPDARPVVRHTVDVHISNVDRDRGSLRNRTEHSFLEVRLGDERYLIAAWNEKALRFAWDWTARR